MCFQWRWYSQLFLDDALYDVQKMLKYEKNDVSEGIDVN